MKVVTAEQMRAIEEAAVQAGDSLPALMQRAGEAVARAAREACRGDQVLILVGPGNNGGDGIVAAETLQAHNVPVVVYTFNRKNTGTFEGKVISSQEDSDGTQLRDLLGGSRVVIDALLGIGQTRPVEGPLADIVRAVNSRQDRSTCVLAVDIPTGIDADTGTVLGVAIQADETIVMGFPKVGNVVYPGAEMSGRLEVVDIGIPVDLADESGLTYPTDADIAALLPERKMNSNKGSNGRVLMVGGSRNFCGAPAMSSLASYRAGAGLLEVATLDIVRQAVAAHALEPIFLLVPETDGHLAVEGAEAIRQAMAKAQAVAIGPGLGLTASTLALTRSLILWLSQEGKRAVIDADGLNALSQTPDWFRDPLQVVLTPHPGEMSRLTGMSIPDIQASRLETARKFAREWGVVVVLKGAGTIVAAPDGRATVNPTGGPNLATAGTGDILTGIISGLLAQRCEPYDAAVAGVYLHGRAGDLVRERLGDAGTLASDLIDQIPKARQSILEGAHRNP